MYVCERILNDFGMKQVETIKYAGLSRNAEHYQLFSGLLAAVTEEFATTYKLTPFRTAFATSFAKENEAYLQNQAYEGTKTVEKANETCDRRFRLFERNVEVGELSDEPAEVEAAERIAFAMKPYKGAPSKPHAENIAMVKDLVEVLESDKYAADVETLGLTSVLASLKQSVVDFETAYAARAGERLARTSMDGMKTIRPVVEQDFANLAALITALYLVAAHVDNDAERAAALGAVVDQMNALILDYHKKLARRGIGSSSQTVSTDPEAPDTEEPETPEEPDEPDEERPGGL